MSVYFYFQLELTEKKSARIPLVLGGVSLAVRIYALSNLPAILVISYLEECYVKDFHIIIYT